MRLLQRAVGNVWRWFQPDEKRWLRPALASVLAVSTGSAFLASAEIRLQDIQSSSPLILNKHEDYLLRNVRVSGLNDQSALLLSGPIRSVTIENSKFGDIAAGPNRKATGLDSSQTSVATIKVSDTAFFDSENQLLCLRDGSFGTVTFLHCTFKNSDAFLKSIYVANPWRTTPPTTEFANIERLELLDNEFSNTTIVIHPSVKTVVVRGEIANLLVESAQTRVIKVPGAALPVEPPQVAAAKIAGLPTQTTQPVK